MIGCLMLMRLRSDSQINGNGKDIETMMEHFVYFVSVLEW
jgi:hypothetical protein